MAMNFVARVIVIALGFITSSVWQTVRRKGMLFERKNTPKLFFLAFNTEITPVVEAEPGMLCEYINEHVIISNSKKEQHVNVPTTFRFFHSE